ncbi:type II toxin-antitoxin system RelE/ParE family toxin [Nostoc sp. PCC 9305]|uniref:type II toxin-antitoxin system RelE/ParE family toxin n=1 Tax=Nostoc sp. PCC 9305 TaxID=296636 RepID=UPI0039C66BE8
MSLILGEIKKVKLPPHKDFSVSLSVAKKWIKSSLDRYVILYQVIDDGVKILRVVSGRQDLESLFASDEE